MRSCRLLLPSLAAFSLLLISAAVSSAPRFVAPGGVDAANACLSEATPCASIQHAVDQADPDDVVHVAPGTYVGSVTLAKRLTLQGPNAAITSFLQARDPDEAIIEGQVLLAVGADGSDIAGFWIRGAANGVAGSAGSFPLDDIRIAGNRFSGANRPINLGAFGAGGALGSGSHIIGNQISELPGNDLTGMLLFDQNDLLVESNEIVHVDVTRSGRRGINLDGIQGGLVQGNRVDLGNVPSGDANADFAQARWAIQVSQSNRSTLNLTLTGNTLLGAYDGIVALSNGDVDGLVISNNSIEDVWLGVRFNAGSGSEGNPPSYSNVSITDNTIDAFFAALRLQNSFGADASNYIDFLVQGNVLGGGFQDLVGALDPEQIAADNTFGGTGLVVVRDGNGDLVGTFNAIQAGINAASAGYSVHVSSGTWEGPFIIDRSISLLGDPLVAPVLTRSSGAAGQTLLLVSNAPEVTISGFFFDIDRSYVGAGIGTNAVHSGLSVLGNEFQFRRSDPGQDTPFGQRHAIALNIGGGDNTLNGGAANILIEDNVCGGDAPAGIFARACVAAFQIGGTVRGNDFQGGFYDVISQFATSALLFEDNDFRGTGLQLSEPNLNGATTVRGNRFVPESALGFGNPVLGSAAVMLKLQNANGAANSPLNPASYAQLLVEDNTFEDFVFGIHVQNPGQLDLIGNSFTPRDGSSEFFHVLLDSKTISSNSNALGPKPLALHARDNHFNASTVPGGDAFLFWNAHGEFDYGSGLQPTSYGDLLIEENSFGAGLDSYMRLLDLSCAASNDVGCIPALAQTLGYAGASIPATPWRPFAGNISAPNNEFAGVLIDANAAAADIAAVEARLVHQPASANLGLIDLGTAAPAEVFVDAGFVAGNYAEPLAFSHGETPVSEVYWQLNAFADIPSALAAVAPGGTVFVAKGDFPGFVLNQQALVVGDGRGIGDTRISGQVLISADGIDATQRSGLRGLRVQDDSSNAVLINTARSFLLFENVQLMPGAISGAGLNINTLAGPANQVDDVLILDALFTGVGFGLRSSSNAWINQMRIENSQFIGNRAGIVLSGASGSGESRTTNWTVLGSEFIANSADPTEAFGGGIWLKTAGAGSLIDNVSIRDSVFRDNGSAQSLNRGGITVRVRPGASLANVEICDNVFGNTPGPGDQRAGIYVYDQTDGNEYDPLLVCGNTFEEGLEYGISGEEQFDNEGTTPLVVLIGNSFGDGVEPVFQAAATVTLLDAADQFAGGFATIQAAIDAAGTDFTVLVPEGTFVEDLNVQNRAGLTLLGAQAGVPAGVDGLRNASSTVGESIVVGELQFGGSAPTVSDLTIDGFRLENTRMANNGARINGALTLRNLIVDGGPATYFLISVGIGPGHSMELVDSSITYGRGFTVGNGQVTSALIERNVFNSTAASLISASAPDGVVIVRDNEFNGPRGINVLSNGNLFEGNEFNVSAGGSSRAVDLYEVTGNTFSGNLFNVADATGILVIPGGRNEPLLENTIIDNSFLGSSGINNTLAKEVDASCNWWGDEEGPSAGTPVSGEVVTLPWNQSPSGPCLGGLPDPVTRQRDDQQFATLGEAIADSGTVDGDVLILGEGVYRESVLLNKSLTIQGQGLESELSGEGTATQPAITLATNVTGIVLQDFAVRNYQASCIRGARNNQVLVQRLDLAGCLGAGANGGIYLDGPIDDVQILDNVVRNSTTRGIVIWNGFKTNVVISGNTVEDIPSCCGIELQDGTASGVLIESNLISNVGDSGMGLTGLTFGAGANVIRDNMLSNTGRFGIEIKLPNGSGLDSGDGAIVVEGNSVSRTEPIALSEERDLGGIVVIRRGYLASEGNADVPQGVVVRGNTVSGYRQVTFSEGFGIVVEGEQMRVEGNTLIDNDVGIQRQAGHLPYEANQSVDGDQSNLDDDYFGRGNSPVVCASIGDDNLFTDNGLDRRDVVPPGQPIDPVVSNVDNARRFCSIQRAIDDVLTVDGHALLIDPGVYSEDLVVDKSLQITGPFVGIPGQDPLRDGSGEAVLQSNGGATAIVRVRADNVVIQGLSFSGDEHPGTVAAIGGGLNFGGTPSTTLIADNRFVDLALIGGAITTNGPVASAFDWVIRDNLFEGLPGATSSAVNYWRAQGGVIENNVMRDIGFAGVQLVNTQGVAIRDNLIENTQSQGIQLAFGVADVQVHDNHVRETNQFDDEFKAALVVFDDATDVSVYCNVLDASEGRNALSLRTLDGPVGMRQIYHNALLGSASIAVQSEDQIVGSNWYGGVAPVLDGAGAASLQLATALDMNPVDEPLCGDNSPVTILAQQGGGQATVIDTAFDDALVVRVSDALGGAVHGETVAFIAPLAGASADLVPILALTDFDGFASTEAAANSIAGSYEVEADVDAQPLAEPASFALTNLPDGPASVTLLAGDLQSTVVATDFAVALQVEVRDGANNLVADGTPVSFTAIPGAEGASLDATPQVANTSNGVASLVVTANTVVGSFSVQASAGTGSVGFSLANTPGAAAALSILSGDEQATLVGTAFALPLQVDVRDAFGNPVSDDTEVTFSAVPAGNGASLAVSPLSADTSAGMAMVMVEANSVSGSYLVTASAGTGSVDFTLSNEPGDAETLIIVAGDGQSAAAGSTLAIAPQVRVEDADGNPVSGILVSFAIISGGGSLTGDSVLSDADGLAAVGSWTLGSSGGSNELAAGVSGTDIEPVLFTAEAVAQVDVAVSVTSTRAFIRVGDVHDHIIIVSNEGVTDASDVAVSVPLPPEHNAATAQWLCLATGGASCGSANGLGAISENVDIPAGGSVIFVSSAQVLGGPTELVLVEATASVDDDIDPDNNIDAASTIVVLFRNGFEAGGDGANNEQQAPELLLGQLQVDGDSLFVSSERATGSVLAQSWLRAAAPGERPLFEVQRSSAEGVSLLRLRTRYADGEQVSAWSPLGESVGLALLQAGGGHWVVLDSAGDSVSLELPGVVPAGLELRAQE